MINGYLVMVLVLFQIGMVGVTIILSNKVHSSNNIDSDSISFWYSGVRNFMDLPELYKVYGDYAIRVAKQIRLIFLILIFVQLMLALYIIYS